MADERDDLESDLRQAFATPDDTPAASETLPETEGVQAGQTIPDKPVEGDGRPRNPDGTFAAKPKEPETHAAPVPQSTGEPPPRGVAPAQPPASPAPDRIAPPETWKGGAKVRWDALPKPVQQEIVADYQRMGQIQSQFDAYQRVLGPKAQQWQAEFGSVDRALELLVNINDFAVKSPLEFINWFANRAGIDLSQMGGQPQQQPGIDPALAPALQPLMQEVNQLKRQLADSQAASQRQSLQDNMESVQAFVADPEHPYAVDVMDDMVKLINGGFVTRGPNALKDAYDRAVWMNLVTRQQVLDGEREKAQKQQQARVAQARQAGADLTGSPLPGANTSVNGPDRSLEDELRHQFRESGLVQ